MNAPAVVVEMALHESVPPVLAGLPVWRPVHEMIPRLTARDRHGR